MASCDAAFRAQLHGNLQKITYISSSSVFDSADSWPTSEGDQLRIPPSRSAYGLQKLAVEYYARAAWEQYGLPYTIMRPSNCVGVGETRALNSVETVTGNIKLATAHVIPDLVQKILRDQSPLHILGDGNQIRHYTYGGDIARGVVAAMGQPAALNEDFNLASAVSTSVRDLASLIMGKMGRQTSDLLLESEPPYDNDVAKRVPDISKARDLLGFEALTTLDQMLDEVIPWISRAFAAGKL
jgi:nucleoside-diphosphate-sugar epimerase